MADLSDVTSYLATQAAAAVYPNGTSSPSVASMDCIVDEGWPIPDELDLDMAGKMKNAAGLVVTRPGGKRAHVTIFPMMGTGVSIYQIQDHTYTITPPTINLTVSVTGTVLTVAGEPATGEYITLVLDEAVVCSQTGVNTQALLAALATQAQSFGYAATSTATTLTVPFGFAMVVRQGGVAVLGKAMHRQRQSVMVTVWAPNRVVRNQLASAIDNVLKQTIRVTMPDTSQAVVRYNRTNVIDEQQMATIYRRDLIYDVEYATVEQFQGFVVTSTQVSIANFNNSAIALAVTGGQSEAIEVPPPPPPPPILTFFLGVNYSGLEDQYPVQTSLAEMTYYANKGVKYVRLPIGWYDTNPTYGTVGIQPTAFGPLDTTSTYLPFIPSVNFLQNSELPNSPPWQTYNATGTLTVTNNAGTGPSGNSSTLVQANRADTTSYFVVENNFTPTTSGNYTGSLQIMAADPGSVGRQVAISFYVSSLIAIVSVTLTNTWQLVSTTDSLTAGTLTYFDFIPFGTSSESGECNFYVSEAQVNQGTSPATYQPTSAGYVQALLGILGQLNSVGQKAIIDIHNYGGPGFLPVTTPGLLANLWGQLSPILKGNPAVWAYGLNNEPVNGTSSVAVQTMIQDCIDTIRANGDNTLIIYDGTNYSGAWNWASGTQQPYNNANLYQLTDPANNIAADPHCYYNGDNSGSTFGYWLEVAKPGVSPDGSPTGPGLPAIRWEGTGAFIPWKNQYGITAINGEGGISNDALGAGGSDNYAAWNVIETNALNILQANNMPTLVWGAGAGFGPFYPPYLGPSNTGNPAAADFTSAGLQSTMMVVLEQYTGYSGAQPTAYRIDLPVTVFPPVQTSPPTISYTVATASDLPGGATTGQYAQTLDTTDLWYYTGSAWTNAQTPTVTAQQYGTVGVASGNFTIRYNGVIPSGGVIITPADHLTDGITSAGGTFTPSTVTLPAGNNAIAHFTYTPSQTATILITATNNAGWINPPVLGFSSQDDPWKDTGLTPAPLYNLYRSYTPHIGPALQLQSPSTGAVQDWYFTKGNNFDRVAIQAWAGQQSGIPVLIKYDQSLDGINETVTGATLNLQNSTSGSANLGYPEIVYTAMVGNAAVNVSRTGALTIIARMEQLGGGGNAPYVSTFLFSSAAPYSFGPSPSGNIFSVENTGYVGATRISTNLTVGSVALGTTNGVWHNYTGTYQQGISSGLISYIDGTEHATATLTPTPTSSFTLSQTGTTGTITNLLGIINIGDVATGTGVPSSNTFVSENSNGTYVMGQSATLSNVACTGVGIWYGLNTGFDNAGAEFGYVSFGSSGWQGSDTLTGFIPGVAVTSGQLATILGYETTHYSSSLPDTLPPILLGVTNQNAVSGFSITPFAGITLQDVAGTSDSIVFTVTGQAATLSGTGLTGSNPYTLTSDTVANINTKLQALQYTATGSTGAVTNIAMLVTSSTALTCSASTNVTLSTATNPTISGMVGPNVSMDQGAPPLWQVTVTDSNPSPMVSAVITVTGSAGTLSHLGSVAPSGSGPYTYSAMTPANLTRALRNLLWAPSVTTVGTTTTFAVVITNALGLTASASNTITNVAVASLPSALTPVATPGTLPPNYRGMNFSGGENFPANYQTSSSLWSWAKTNGFTTIRLPFLFTSMQIVSPVADFAFPATITGSLAGNVLTVTATNAPIMPQQSIYLPGGNYKGLITTIVSNGTGTGGVGTYNVFVSTPALSYPSQTFELGHAVSQLYANFNSGDVSSIQTCLELARANGQYVLLDDHSYGNMFNPFPVGTPDEVGLSGDNVYTYAPWGTDVRTPTSGFADSWTRMAKLTSLYSNVLIDMQNEPSWTQAYCRTAMTAVSASVRANASTTVPILAPSPSNASGFNTTGVWTGYTDPAGGPFYFPVHQYFDNDGGGLNTCVSTTPATYFGAFFTYLRAQGFQGFVSEWAVGTDTTCIPTLLENIMTYFEANDDVLAGWNWWGGGDFPTSYMFYMGPAEVAPQYPYLEPYLP